MLMRTLLSRLPAVMTLALVSACGSKQDPEDATTAPLWDTLAEEGRFFSRFLAGEGWLTLSAIAIATAVLWVLLSLTIRVVRDSGYDDEQRSGQIRVLGRVFIVLVAAALLSRFAFRVAPTTSLALTMAGLGILLVFMLRRLRGGWAVISLTLAGKLREGDEITLGAHHGTLKHVGLLRLVLGQPGGATLLVSSRLLTEHELMVRPKGSPPSLKFRWKTDGTEANRTMAEQTAAACPYRLLARTPVSRRVEGGIEIELSVWSTAQVVDAERWLARALEPDS
ncbi:MAG: hypothetical protein ACI9OJ_004284 [Myxococcota bacterium]|jgi:hypothetical protein